MKNAFLSISALTTIFLGAAACLGQAAGPSLGSTRQLLRPPAVPLVTHDPYFSIWSMSDHLTDDSTQHWTGFQQPLLGLIRIDGRVFRWMGIQVDRSRPQAMPALTQSAVEVTPTRTTYHFEERGIRFEVSFLSPLLPSDPEVLARPITYVTFTALSIDGAPHSVQVLFEASSLLAVDSALQSVVWSRSQLPGITLLRAGNLQQPVLEKSDDNRRIDWGYVFTAVPNEAGTIVATIAQKKAEAAFVAGMPLGADDINMPEFAYEAAVLASEFDLGKVAAEPIFRHVLLGYDDLYSVEYLKRWLQAYWHRSGRQIDDLVESAERDYSNVERQARQFDTELLADLRSVGGEHYAQLAALAFRQTLAAHKVVADVDGRMLAFSKENSSAGCISTIDVIYPTSPLLLLVNPELLEAQLRPVMEYVRTGRWHFPFAPHDLGLYPKANGSINERASIQEPADMYPVEESGDMLLMAAALSKAEGNAHFAKEYWPELTQWAQYLQREGFDPSNQVSTDDFTGPIAHNTNLSMKAILAIAAYATLADKTGHSSEARQYKALSRAMARRWTTVAQDGDHFRLAFDQPDTWSQKYNLVWDRILGLKVFPPEVAREEIAFYKKQQNRYGLPLDSRARYAKLDWLAWTATLTESRVDFDALLEPAYRFVNDTPVRIPLTDFFDTDTGAATVEQYQNSYFKARPVVGAVFMPMLAHDELWKKWSTRARPR